ncbi:D-alanyl-D-alanine carboxypeptidase/D-alanyl-D-alanine endopeptidase [Dyella lipolytica]|uniref:D-alanyl-D-alanine carboxypeptidase/D-alanyl-D-alanine-endopeptidase n=1 Tax=Dyella lipolytica TaxID=1867835 RepID=A0ABW8IUR3_9GAMM|nr:D-alanyl-D-alanine carboxypeptidase/D-alanyl-D-alanine-endopeptidase [Dyella lipolytica]
MNVDSWRALFRIGMVCMALGAAGTSTTAITADTPAVVATSTAQQLAAAIDTQIGQPRFASSSWGIAVTSLDTGRTLYAHNADRLLQTASTAKLYTAALVLDTLGTDYRIPTQLLITRRIQYGRLDGPLILRGMGDPTLGTPGTNSDWADQLATQLASNGIQEVRGDLIADDSYFSGPTIGSGWEASDLQDWFAVPASALSVQENVVNLTVAPSSHPGGLASLIFDPPGAIPHVVNNMVTGASNTRNDINLYRAPGNATLYAFGNVAARAEPRNFKLAVADPAWLAGTALHNALARRGIRIDGQLRVMHWPEQSDIALDKATVVAQVLSPPVMEVLTRGLKRSQNLYLQNLLQIAGVKAQTNAEQAGDPANGFLSTESWAIRALRQLLDRIGMPPDASQIQEGTGLSRQDLATPNAMVDLLTYLVRQPYGAQLRDALPTAGVDGTLEWRMRDSPAVANVHAKTGSMTYVRCIVGYVTTASGERLAFAIMLNNVVQEAGEASPSRNLDAIVELLAAFDGHS